MKLLIANPCHSVGYASGAEQAVAVCGQRDLDVQFYTSAMSLLTLNFNTAWCEALNNRVDYFLMVHADVRPIDPGWLDTLLKEMEKYSADVLSVIIPIKHQDGVTSTAIETDNLWRPRRITVTEALDFPETWSRDGLLFNTGMMLVDFRKPWVGKICFTVNDRITRAESGRWVAEVEPEDWNFSRQCRKLGLSCYVTRKVRVDHYGEGVYPNYMRWGEKFDGESKLKQRDGLSLVASK